MRSAATFIAGSGMSRNPGDDPYLDPESGVLRNRLGISDEATLEQAEAALVATRSFELSLAPLNGLFDLAHLQAIHRYLFGDVYEWAGHLRTIDISKGGHLFAHHAHIVSAAAPIFHKLAEGKHLVGLGRIAFCERAAHYLGELNALHPFREGNGRAQREFISHLAHTADYYIAWKSVGRAEMLEASIQSFTGDTSRLDEIIRENLHRLGA